MENLMQAMESSTRGAENIRLLLVVVCFFAVLFGLCIGVYFYRKLVLPLSRFTEGLHRAANADLTVTVDSLGTSGELKDLIEGVNRLIRSFSKSLNSMKQLAERVQISSRNLNEVSMETFTAMDDQQKRAMQISQATEEMTSTTQAIAENAMEANKKASEVDEMLQKGNLIIEDMITLSEEMAHDLNLSAGRVSELAQDSEKINSIIGIIRAIASQTKLLALNAAVEAARAGKHGRGFAVVAEEVKKLAQESASSISGIEEIIENVRKKITQALHEISTSAEKASGHQAKSREIVGHLQEIGHSTKDLTEQISQIAQGTEEQNRAFPTIASSIETITGTTSTTTQQMESIYKQINELEIMCEELMENINIYTVSSEKASSPQQALQLPTLSE
jgi:methyl-accepting chemotaxis protein